MSWGSFTARDAGGNAFAWLVDAVAAGKALGVQQATDGDPLAYSADGGITVDTTADTIAAQNLNRKRIEVYNSGTVAVWIAYGSAAPVVGKGAALPPGAKDVFYTTSAVKGITASGSAVVGWTEW